jgi:DNA-directed RNA polymerase specialized sigma24 family protein
MGIKARLTNDDAEELAQETIINVSRMDRPIDDLSSYLQWSMRNAIKDFRKRRVTTQWSDNYEFEDWNSAGAFITCDINTDLERFTKELTEMEYRVFVRLMNGYSDTELEESLRRSPRTIDRHKRNLRLRLQAFLEANN